MKNNKNYDINISIILQDMVAVLIIIVSLGIMIMVGKSKEKWVLDDNKIYKGNEVYEIGDYYDYD